MGGDHPNRQTNDLENFFPAERQRRLDLILHLIPNTRQTILLRGPEQSGKSFFIRELHKQVDKNWQFCSIQANQLMQTNAPLQVLAEAINGLDEKNHQILVRLESWSKLGQKVIVCVENAHLLAIEQLNSLFKLVDSYECIHLILTSSENLGGSIESRCQLVDLEPFTQKQTKQYAKLWLQSKGLDFVNLAGVDDVVLFIETGGLPGRINDVLGQVPNKPGIGAQQKTASRLPMRWLLGLAVLVTSALIVIFLYPEEEHRAIESIMQIDESAKEIASRPLASSTLDSTMNEPVNKEEERINKVLPVIKASPAAIALSPSLIQQEETLAPVTIKNSPAARDNVSLQEPESKDVQEEPAVDEETSVLPKDEKAIAESPKELNELQEDMLWIKSRDKNHYTLQLIGVSTEESAHNYILRHKELKSLYFFQNKKNQGQWYSVIYGDYANKEKALEASRRLRSSLGKLKPWARSFDGVQADLLE